MPFFQDETDCLLLRKIVGKMVQPSMKGLQNKPVLSSSQDGLELLRSCQRDADLIIWLFLFPRVVKSYTSEAQLLPKDVNMGAKTCCCAPFFRPAAATCVQQMVLLQLQPFLEIIPFFPVYCRS